MFCIEAEEINLTEENIKNQVRIRKCCYDYDTVATDVIKRNKDTTIDDYLPCLGKFIIIVSQQKKINAVAERKER